MKELQLHINSAPCGVRSQVQLAAHYEEPFIFRPEKEVKRLGRFDLCGFRILGYCRLPRKNKVAARDHCKHPCLRNGRAESYSTIRKTRATFTFSLARSLAMVASCMFEVPS